MGNALQPTDKRAGHPLGLIPHLAAQDVVNIYRLLGHLNHEFSRFFTKQVQS
jgi:hypothetical protein